MHGASIARVRSWAALMRATAIAGFVFVSLVTASSAFAAIDLLGRTEATFSWEASEGYVDSYDVYLACADGVAPTDFDATPTLSIPAEPPSVLVEGAYGLQCKVRIVANDIYGRVSALSSESEVINFVAPESAHNDFDGDGYSDIIVQDPDDGSAILISGADLSTGVEFLHQRTTISTSGNLNWDIVDTGDFNGDGSPDFLWFTTTDYPNLGITTYTYVVGSEIHNRTVVFNGVTDDVEIIDVADYNGDGSDDILHRINDIYGTVHVTFMGPAGVIRTSRYEGALGSQFDFVASGDYDGDENADVMWRRKETGQTVVWLMKRPGRMTFANSGVLVENDWVGEAAGNFNNSVEDDVLWRNLATGETRVWYMDDFEAPEELSLNASMPSNWSLLASGDTDGDGRADLTWFNADTNLLEVWRMDETQPGGFTLE